MGGNRRDAILGPGSVPFRTRPVVSRREEVKMAGRRTIKAEVFRCRSLPEGLKTALLPVAAG